MLTTIALLLACVACIASDYTTPYYKPPTDAYPAYPQTNDYGLSSGIDQDIKRLYEQLYALEATDEDLADLLFDIAQERKGNTQLIGKFLTEDLPALRQRQATQSDDISKLEQQVEALLLLNDELIVLNSTLDELSIQASALAEESVVIEGEAYLLSKDDKQQERRLAAVNARIAEQERKSAELNNATLALSDKLNSNLELIDKLFSVVDREEAEVVVAVLTKEAPQATKEVEKDFSKFRPDVLFGFSSIHITDESNSYVLPDNYGDKGYGDKGYGDKGYDGKGYGRYQSNYRNASISFHVDAVFNVKANQVTFYLVDTSSGGFVVRDVTVVATLINIDNDKYEIESEKSSYYY